MSEVDSILLAKKSNKELDNLIDNNFKCPTLLFDALLHELKKRNYRIETLPEIEAEKEKRNKIFKEVQKIKFLKKTSFRFEPKFEEEFKIHLPEKLAINCITKAMVYLGWTLVYFENSVVEAKSIDRHANWKEKITINVKNNSIIASSESIKDIFCDFGRNSKRIEELMYVYKKLESEYDENSISEEVSKVNKEEKKNEYNIPVELTKPKEEPEQRTGFLLVGGLILSLTFATVLAISSHFFYIILIVDFIIGFSTAHLLSHLLLRSNISDLKRFIWRGHTFIVLMYVFSPIYGYIIFSGTESLFDKSIFELLYWNIQNTLDIISEELSETVLILAWLFELVFALGTFHLIYTNIMLTQSIENAPNDVVEFALYHLKTGKNEDEIRMELEKKGWYTKQHQDVIFKSIEARKTIQDRKRF